jgi:spoIIIJ-associated protein
MNEIIKEAKTIESAIALVTSEFNCSQNDLNIEILQEPVKGIFGLTKMAKIKATLKNTDKDSFLIEKVENNNEIDEIKSVLEKIITLMKIDFKNINILQEEESIIFEIVSESEGLLIGHHGKTIESIQYLINKIISQKDKKITKFFIDIGGYLNKHKQNLKKIAENAVNVVKETKENFVLEPMNAYDRRIIHLFLKDNEFVTTFSQGEGNYRHIVISSKNNNK